MRTARAYARLLSAGCVLASRLTDSGQHRVLPLEAGPEHRPIDVNHSDWDCTLEPSASPGGLALRLTTDSIRNPRDLDRRGPRHPCSALQPSYRTEW